MPLNTDLIISVFFVACNSIAKAALVVASGVLLARRGALTPDVRQGISRMAAGLLVPCLLLERMASTVTLELLSHAYFILPAGLVYVAIGSALGTLTAWCTGVPPALRRPTVAATTFANSQALPIIIVEVIGPELFGPEAATLGITYIGLYLIVYLVLQWTIGASLLDVPLLSVGGGSRAAPAEPSGRGSDGVAMLTSVAPSDAPRDASAPTEAAKAPDDPVLGQWRRVVASLRAVGGRVASPPIYGIAVGLVLGLTPPLRGLVVSTTEQKAPLRCLMQAARLLGNAAIPINTMLLGASLSKGPTWHAVRRSTIAGVVLCKLVVLPLIALLLVGALSSAVTLPPMLALVLCIESAMPTANNLMMMCELAGGSASKMMSTVIFAQYVCSPVLLTASLTASMTLVQHHAGY